MGCALGAGGVIQVGGGGVLGGACVDGWGGVGEVVIAGGSPGGGDELGIGVDVAGAQEAGVDVPDGVFATVGLHLDGVVGAVEDVVLDVGLDAGAEIGCAVTAGNNAVAHCDGDVRQLVVAGVHGIGAAGGIVVDGDIDDFKGVAVVLLFDHQTGPGAVAADSVAGAVNQAILHLAAATPELDAVAGVVGHKTMMDGCVRGFGVEAVSAVVLGGGVFDFDGTGRRLDAETVGAVVWTGAGAPLVIVAVLRKLRAADDDVPPTTMLPFGSADTAESGVGDGAILDDEVLHICDVHSELINVMDRHIFQCYMDDGPVEGHDGVAEPRAVVAGDFDILDGQVTGETDGCR